MVEAVAGAAGQLGSYADHLPPLTLGDHYYWVATINASGLASSPAGPEVVSVYPPPKTTDLPARLCAGFSMRGTMPKSVNEVFRDFTRYEEDGRPNAPVGHQLPIGDPRSGVWNPSKSDIRDALGGVFDAAELAMQAAIDVHGATLFAADLPSLLADTATSYPVGTTFATRSERYGLVVVASDPSVTTAGGVMLQPSPQGMRVTPRMFGAVGDGVTNDRSAIQRCWEWGAANKITVDMEGLEYASNEALYTDGGADIVCRGAVVYFTAWPAVGAFITNVWGAADTTVAPARRIQRRVRIDGLIGDGSRLPAPVAGQQHNSNIFGFARGASDVILTNCRARKMRLGTGGGTGGQGFGTELGATDILYDNCVAEDCYLGCRVQSEDGTWTDAGGASKRLRRVRFRNFTAIRCGAAIFGITPLAVQTSELESSNFDAYDVVFDGVTTAIDCGHYPWTPITFPAGLAPQKTGVVVFGGARNILIRHLRIRISSDLTTRADWLGRSGYPASGDFVGRGLSGSVGAAVWGHGRNIAIDRLELDGSVDVIYRCARGVAFGEIASVPPTATTETRQIKIGPVSHVYGACEHIFDAMQTSGGTGLDNSKLSIRMEVTPNALTGAVVGPNGTAGGLSAVYIAITTQNGRIVDGSAAEFLSSGVTLAALPADETVIGSFAAGGGYTANGTRAGLTYSAKSLRLSGDTGSPHQVAAFYNTNGLVGAITTSGTSTTFNTSSDARLKSDPRDFDALGIVSQFRVYDHAWRSGGRGHNFYAQEAFEVMPECVTVGDSDEDWNAKGPGDRIPWQMDHSKVVPVLTRAIQQLLARVNVLDGGANADD